MAIDAGNSDCTTGLSKALFDALLGDSRIPWPSGMTDAQKNTPKAIAYAIASQAASSYNSDSATVHAACSRSTTQTIPMGASTVLDFSTKEEDTHNAVTTGAAWRFVVPSGKGGRYLICSAVAFTSSQSGTVIVLAARVNGAERRRLGRINPVSPQWPAVSGSTVLTLASGDVVDVAVTHDSPDAGGEVTEGLSSQTYVTITRLGD